MSWVLAFLGFALLIVLHEAGHFAAAKAVGMRVERFSLFFGPMFWKRRIGETDYGIGIIPLGGYVKITGMDSNETFESAEIESRAYISQPVWKRIIVIAAGPAVNLLLAFLLAWLYLSVTPQSAYNKHGQLVATTTVGAIMRGSAADGTLRLGDRIVSVDGVRGDAEQIHDQIAKHTCADDSHVNGCRASAPATIVVRRDGHLRTLIVRPRWSSSRQTMLVGFGFASKLATVGALAAAGQSVRDLWHVATATVSDIAELFKPKDRSQLHSIVGAYAYTQQEIASGWSNGIQIMALISLSLGVINLFPFLPLDGGHIFWALAEKIRGRRIPLATMERASLVGIALIGILLFVGLSNDISAIAGKGLGTH
jgi:regulator of sigma E protease